MCQFPSNRIPRLVVRLEFSFNARIKFMPQFASFHYSMVHYRRRKENLMIIMQNLYDAIITFYCFDIIRLPLERVRCHNKLHVHNVKITMSLVPTMWKIYMNDIFIIISFGCTSLINSALQIFIRWIPC